MGVLEVALGALLLLWFKARANERRRRDESDWAAGPLVNVPLHLASF